MRVHPHIIRTLEQCGKPWEVKQGSRHLKIVVDGVLAGILPKDGMGRSEGRAQKNLVAQIKRAARGIRP